MIRFLGSSLSIAQEGTVPAEYKLMWNSLELDVTSHAA